MTIYKRCGTELTIATFFPALTKKPPAMKLHTAAILVIFCLGVLPVHTVEGSASSQSMQKRSCVDLSAQQLNIRNVASYEKQQNPVEAIMFITKKGFRICVSPNQKWVQTLMKKIDQKRTTKRR